MLLYLKITKLFLTTQLFFFEGESGVGKTTFVNTLFTTSIKEYKNPVNRHEKQLDRTVEIEITKAGKINNFFFSCFPSDFSFTSSPTSPRTFPFPFYFL